MKKLLIIITFVTLSISVLSAEYSYSISGRIIDQVSQIPIPYAGITLFMHNDSTMVDGLITDDNGEFQLNKLHKGQYDLRISFMGYQTRLISDLTIESASIAIGTIELFPDNKELNEVVVTGAPSAISYKVDRKVINAASFPGANVALDLLENVPSLQVSADGKLTYRGDGVFKVYINGHPVDNGDEKLRQIPANRIEKVEVITNPSSSYSSEGTAGIIHVILKKNRLEGYAITSTIKDNTRGGYLYSFSIDRKYEKSGWSISGDIGKAVYEDATKTDFQEITSGNDVYQYLFDIDMNETSKSSNLEIGYNWDISKKDYLNFAGHINPMHNKSSHSYKGTSEDIHYQFNALVSDSLFDYRHDYQSNYGYAGATLDYSHNFNDEGTQVLSFYVDYSTYLEALTSKTIESKLFEDIATQQGKIYKEDNEMLIEAKINYLHPLKKEWTLEIGFDANIDHIPNLSLTNGTFDASGNLNPFGNESKNQEVKFVQDIYAPYFSIQKEWSKFSMKAGTRVERTNRRADYSYISTSDQLVTQPYNDQFSQFFPTVHMVYNFSENQQMMMGYSRRIQRPDYWEFMPLKEYTSYNDYFVGNTDLQPSFTDAYEIAFKKSWDKDFLSIETFFRNSTDVIATIYEADSQGGIVHMPMNAGNSVSSGIEVMGGVDLFKWWNLNASFSSYYYGIDITYASEKNSDYTWQSECRLNNSFTLPAALSFKWNFKYNSPSIEMQSHVDGYYTSDVSISKGFNEKRWLLVLTYVNLFDSDHYETVTRSNNLYISNNYRDRPYLSLRLTYTFNNQQ